MYTIVNYSEKAIALTGDTKIIKDQLKNLGGRYNAHLTCGAGWIFSKSKEVALRKFLDFPQMNETSDTPKDFGNIYKDALRAYVEEHPENAGKYWVTEVLGALKLEKGYIFAPKQEITTRFWLSDEGEELEYYYQLLDSKGEREKYFLTVNLRKVELSEDEFYVVDDRGEIQRNTYYLLQNRWHGKQIFRFSAEELDQIKQFSKWQKQLFEKRLNTYLRRWGVEKLSFSTYWANR